MASQAQFYVDSSIMPVITCTASIVINRPANVVHQVIQMETPQLNETKVDASHKEFALLTREPGVFFCSLRSKAERDYQVNWLNQAVTNWPTAPLDVWQFQNRYRIEEKLVARHDISKSATRRSGLVLEFEIPRYTAACNDGVLLRVEHIVMPLTDSTTLYERVNKVLFVRPGAASDVVLRAVAQKIGGEEVRQQVAWFKKVVEKPQDKVRAPYVHGRELESLLLT